MDAVYPRNLERFARCFTLIGGGLDLGGFGARPLADHADDEVAVGDVVADFVEQGFAVWVGAEIALLADVVAGEAEGAGDGFAGFAELAADGGYEDASVLGQRGRLLPVREFGMDGVGVEMGDLWEGPGRGDGPGRMIQPRMHAYARR